MMRLSTIAVISLLTFSSSVLGSSVVSLKVEPSCPSNASCLHPTPVHSEPPPSMSMKPDKGPFGICFNNVMGWLTRDEAKLCEAFLASDHGTKRERASALVNLSYSYVLQPGERSNPKLTIAALDQAIAEDPSFAEPHVVKGDIAEFIGNQNDAIANYDRGLALDPKHWRALMGKAGIFQSRGELEKALALANQAVDAAPDVSIVHQRLGSLLQRMHDWEGAISAYRKSAELYDGVFKRLPGIMQEQSPWSALASAELRFGDPALALEAINHEVEGKPQNQVQPDILIERASIFESLGQSRNAAEDYDKVIALLGPEFPQSEEFKARAAALRASSGDTEAARESFRDLLRSGKLQSILRVQVFLNNQGFDDVPIDGKSTPALEATLERCLADKDCLIGIGQSI